MSQGAACPRPPGGLGDGLCRLRQAAWVGRDKDLGLRKGRASLLHSLASGVISEGQVTRVQGHFSPKHQPCRELAFYSGGGPARLRCTGPRPSPGLPTLTWLGQGGASKAQHAYRWQLMSQCPVHSRFSSEQGVCVCLAYTGKNKQAAPQSCEEIYSSKMNGNWDSVENPLGPVLLGSASFHAHSTEIALRSVVPWARYVTQLKECLPTCIKPWV